MISRTIISLTLCAAGASVAFAAEDADKQAMIDNALGAAPPMIAENAAVVDSQGNVLREGTNAYTCMPADDVVPAPMCLDEPWMKWADAFMNKTDFQPEAMGIAYMLAGDAGEDGGGGASNIDPYAQEPTADNQWVIEGPHLMLLVPDQAMLETLPTDPAGGEPYVMWKGTPLAHVMVPTGERPQQPQVAESQ